VGELINVVAGNIKSLVPGPSVLSLPSVSIGGLHALPGHLELAEEVRFSWMAEPVVVTVWTDPAAASARTA
jgi:chemotaxis protein CheX